MLDVKLLAILAAIISIVFGVVLIKKILKAPSGNDKMKEIANAIQEGAKAYLTRQYKTIAYLAVVIFIIL